MINKNFHEDNYYNEVLFESPNFIVIPSLGSLVEGWLLFVPKKHFLSIGLINNKEVYQELNQLIKEVSIVIKSEFGSYIMFEHGPICENTTVGCGVDYAHLHIVPIQIDLINECKKINDLNFHWEKVSDISDTSKNAMSNKPYLYFSNETDCFMTNSNNIPSQLFRKIIANNIGSANIWDWKLNDGKEKIMKTIEKVKRHQEQHTLINAIA